MSLELSGTTGVKGVAGSVSAPAITGDDANTGISFPSADVIKFSANGVEKFAISTSGLSGDGSGLTGIAGGISEIDLYRLHSNFQGTTNPIASNWERFDSQTEGKLGTGMSESSGLFTFPSTGYYYVHFTVAGYRGASSSVQNITSYIRTTTAGSTSSGTHYNSEGRQSMYSESGNSAFSCTNTTIFKCSNTSNDKIFFGVAAESSVYIQGNTGSNFTYVVFIKLADL